MTDTFAGISPQSVPLFVAGQLIGGAAATLLARWRSVPSSQPSLIPIEMKTAPEEFFLTAW